MTFAFSPQPDFETVADGLQAVALEAPGGQVLHVAAALKRAAVCRQADESGGRTARHDAYWHLPVAQVPAAPGLGSLLVEGDGTWWTILQVEEHVLGGRWRCLARRLSLQEDFSTLVTIEAAAGGKDAHGAATVVWQTFKPNVRACIQPAAVATSHLRDAPQSTKTHFVYLLEDLDLGAGHRIRAADGRLLRIDRADRIHQLGNLMRLYATQL